MFAVVLCYAVAILLLANAGTVNSTPLYWIDWVMAIYFAIIGSVAGWQNARR
jgi:hypothetical protein